MPILIDGHNLIGRLPTISLQDPDDESELLLLLQSYRARTGKRVSVVFDAGGAYQVPKTARYGGIEVTFAPHNSSADAVILGRVRKSKNPQQWLVVSSDLALLQKAASAGARTLTADEFAVQLAAQPQSSASWKDVTPSEQEVQDWLRLFQKREQGE